MKLFTLTAILFVTSLFSYAQVNDTVDIAVPARDTVVVIVQDESESQKTNTKAKTPEKSKVKLDKSRIYFGGYMTMNFGKNYSVIGAAPMVAYKITPKFSMGAQLTYEYINDSRYVNDQNGSNYGISIFNRLRVSQRLYAHTEFSLMSYKWFYDDGREDRKTAPMFFVGGGYSQPIAKNVWLNAQVLFDVLNHDNSPYKDWEPYYSIGIGVGF